MNPVTPNTVSASTSTPAEAKQIPLKDISFKWGKFAEQELMAKWFVPPIIIPAALVALIAATVFFQNFAP
jgi:hypothetical protein